MKKVMTIVLIMILLISAVTVYADKKTLSKAEELTKAGILLGTGNGLELNRIISRAEIAELIYRTTETEKKVYSYVFSDVSKTHWAHASISWAVENEIMQCVNDNVFQPQKEVSVKELVMMLLCISGDKPESGDAFKLAKEKALILEEDLIDESNILTREDASKIIYNYVKKNNCEGEVKKMEYNALELTGVVNAWSLGGYVSQDGKKVKENLLYRTGKLSTATEDDICKLKEKYNVSVIVDFRSEDEAASEPDPEIEGVSNVLIPVLETGSLNQQAVVEIYRKSGNDAGKMYLEMVRAGVLRDDLYTSFFDSDACMDGYRKFFDILLDEKDGAVLWHCTGGKDRTGVATMMLLTILDVDKETIISDFSRINVLNRKKMEYIASEVKKHTDDPEEIWQAAILSGVSVPHLEMVYEKAEAECGSMKAYIQKRVGLSDEEVNRLKDMYLE